VTGSEPMQNAVLCESLPVDPQRDDGPVVRRRAVPRQGAPVPAIVIGSGLTALGVLRLLHRARIPAFTISPAPSLEAGSRWFRPLPTAAPAASAGSALASLLEASTVPRAVLIPCSDAAVNEIATLPATLAARFPASVAAPEVIRQLTDKAHFARLLDELDVARPRSFIVNRPEDLDAVPDAALESAFLKPRDSDRFEKRYRTKALPVSGRAEAAARLAETAADGFGVILQEFIPGPGSNHYLIDGFADAHSRIRGLFARRRIRMYPPNFGNSSYMVSVPLTSLCDGAAALERIIAALHYRGIFSAEFKFDARDGRFKLLEINARAWWYIEFAGRCGVDVCRMAYFDALGDEVPEVRAYRVGARLVYPYPDFFAAADEWRAGRLSLAAWFTSWCGAQDPMFNWSDPLPAVREWLGNSGRALRRRLRRTARPS